MEPSTSLSDKYGYQDGDITMMLDDEETLGDPERSHLVPLRENLVSLVFEPHPQLLPYQSLRSFARFGRWWPAHVLAISLCSIVSAHFTVSFLLDTHVFEQDAGHGQQIETTSKNEDDGFDEGSYSPC